MKRASGGFPLLVELSFLFFRISALVANRSLWMFLDLITMVYSQVSALLQMGDSNAEKSAILLEGSIPALSASGELE